MLSVIVRLPLAETTEANELENVQHEMAQNKTNISINDRRKKSPLELGFLCLKSQKLLGACQYPSDQFFGFRIVDLTVRGHGHRAPST